MAKPSAEKLNDALPLFVMVAVRVMEEPTLAEKVPDHALTEIVGMRAVALSV